MNNEVDSSIIRKAIQGDTRAFKQIYDVYAPFVWKALYRTVNGDQELAADIMQETFFKVWRSLPSFKKESTLSTWIYRIAFNTAYSYILKWKPRQETAQTEIENQAKSTDAETQHYIREILAGLSVEERFLLVSREVVGLSFDELSLILGRETAALRTALHRLKEKIRKEEQHD